MGDLSGDCIVNLNDLLVFSSQWLQDSGCSGLGCADLNGDYNVNMADYALLAANWYEQGNPLVINEFMASNTSTPADPCGDFPDWIEIYNVSSLQVNLKDWHLTDDANDLNKWEFPALLLDPGQFLLVFASDKNLRDPLEPLHTNFKLSASGEYLALVRPDGTIAHEYAPKYPQQCTDISYGMNFELDTPVFFTTPTPGEENGLGAEELGPIITDTEHTPAVPQDGDDIVVTAKITEALEPVDTSSVKLHYRVMFGSEPNVMMYDDGFHGDGGAGDDIYGASIPASASEPNQMVRWYITAKDINNIPSRWPLFPYPDNSPEYLGTIIANPSITSNLPILHWFVEDTAAADNKNKVGTRASLYYDGQFYDNLFCRVRGGSLATYPKKSYKFDFNRGFHFQFSPSEGTVEEFNLNATYTDKAYIRQTLAFETYRDAGVPYSISFPMRVQRNCDFFNVSIFIEQPDDDYLERQGLDPEGALYKMYNPLNSATSGVEKRTRRDEDHSDLQALVDGLNDLTGEDKRRFLFDNINIPSVVNYIAATAIMNDNDHVKKNYYAYRDTNGSKEWLYLPWDKDLTFGKMWTPSGGCLDDELFYYEYWGSTPVLYDGTNRLIEAIYEFDDTRQMYLRRLRTLMDDLLQSTGTPYTERKYEQHIDDMVAQMAPDVAIDYNQWCNPWPYGEDQSFNQAVAYLKSDYLDPRRTYLFITHSVDNGGIVPNSQPANPVINFDSTVEFNPSSGNQDEEYIRLDNPNAYAVDISGYRLTDAVEYTFQPGTVIPADGNLYVSPDVRAFRARSTSPKGGEGLFVQGSYEGHLSSWSETINLLDTDANLVDTITYPGNPSEQQRYLRITEMMYHPADPNPGSPYNDEDFEYIELKNIGPNILDLNSVKFTDGIIYNFPSASSTITDVSLIGPADSWKYEESFTDLGTAWRAADYNDSSWPEGAAILYKENAGAWPPPPWTKNTTLTTQNGKITFYFRTHFNLGADPATDDITLEINTLIDDGMVLYLNGAEVLRLGMPDGTITYSSLADRTVNNAATEGPFSIPVDNLVAGDNVLAVEVHQASSNSSDIVFGLTLDATVTIPGVPSIILEPNEYVLVVKDINAFAERYPNVPAEVNILGSYDGQLSNGGETVKLEDSTNNTILEFDYDDGWYPITDGSGFPLVILDANNPNLDSWDDKDGWRPGAILGGSPGEDDPQPLQYPGDVVINEVLAHSHGGTPDWIELHNTTDANINIGGWFLSDSDDDFMKYRIADGTIIDANSYIVFYEDTDFNDPCDPGCLTTFALSENGETVYLSSALAGELTGYSECKDFGASETGVSFGLYLKSTADTDFVAMDSNTPGSDNAYPKVGPIVINEIMFNPESGNQNEEYVELFNITASPVALYNFVESEPWRFTDGIEFTFPADANIPAYGYMVVAKDPAAFTSRYGSMPPGAQVLGPYEGQLSNAGEKIEIGMPGDVDANGQRQYIRIDHIRYDDNAPWPITPDGYGKSLTRKNPSNYGNDIVNWDANSPSPGS